jgi:hypothetical protein
LVFLMRVVRPEQLELELPARVLLVLEFQQQA